MMVLIGILFSFPSLYKSGNRGLTIIWILIFLFMVILYFLLRNKHALSFVEKKILNLPLSKAMKEKTGRLTEAMQQFNNLNLKDHFEIIGLMILYHGLGVVSFFCLAKALNIELSIWVIGWIRSAMSISIMLPFSFAGFGIREGTLVFLLGQYGVTPSYSIAFSFLIFSRSLLTVFAGGLFELNYFVFSRKIKNDKSVESIENSKSG